MSAVLDPPMPTWPLAWRRPLATLAAVIVALLLLYLDTWAGMVGIWMRSDTFAHAFLVLPISLWLVWRRRDRLVGQMPQAQPVWLLPLALAAALWLPGDIAGANALSQLAVTAMLVLAVVAVLGTRIAREIAFPLGFLFFMVPIGEFLMPTFMAWTADFTVAALRLSGVPVYREGLNFVVPSGSWSVVEACSGIRYLIASLMVGTLFAYLNFSSLRRRLLFCAVALVVPVLANWVRAYLIVMLGHLSNNRLAAGVDHIIYGWVFFGVIIVAMFMIGSRWADPVATSPAPRSVPQADASRASRAGLVTVLALAVLALPPAWRWQESERSAASLAPLALQLPPSPEAPAVPPGTAFEPVFVNPSEVARRSYSLADGVVQLHVAYYRQQGFGRKLTSSDNMLVASRDSEWLLSDSGMLSDAQGVEWRRAELRRGGAAGSLARARLDVRQAYWVGGRLTTSEMAAAGLSLWNRLRGQGDDAAMITFYTDGLTPAETAARLDLFSTRYLSAITDSLGAAQAAGRGRASATPSSSNGSKPSP